MTSRPILFSPLLAKAICAGAKTQTRRPIAHPFAIGERDDDSPWPFAPQLDENDGETPWIACPFGRPGDQLWVRETFSPRGRNGDACRIEDAEFAVLSDGTQVCRDGVVGPALAEYAPGAFDGIKWRPSIHMPRWASRITLEIVGIRVERLHSISDADVVAEGVWGTELHDGQLVPASGPSMSLMSPMKAWKVTWSASYGTGAWDRNPWVWAIEFRRLVVNSREKYSVRRDDGRWYSIDDRGDAVWSEAWNRLETTADRCREIVASYAISTRRKLRVVEAT